MFLFLPIVCGISHYDSNYKPKKGNMDRKAPPITDFTHIYCPKCRNYSAKPVKRRDFFSVFFVPILPVYFGKQIRCTICNWKYRFQSDQDLYGIIEQQRQNMEQSATGGGGFQQQQQQVPYQQQQQQQQPADNGIYEMVPQYEPPLNGKMPELR
ncbi:hypothetical protein Kpol_1065p39 [Vanderwaltozyma polyspora DSM 70294]|uniref:Zinc-ribbon 15 domain-containing protein n=1 Tax=Vanderwaltozyma polyspora (strain ATCC 22028 / DSM 70294 / BCRC 21397 / CBS 2163 / NBRC 10782 / NRRL Y-8283 / UCD 57-17) TaxID=436907 RepID=A7TL60_VANPO|nr:uncharacterized protein Kpol_1065p39 [Vanderwaltozyma polyspora DSM 70294]EDO17023.1 hypothetical protein Kpol_1065p39 [Vanderwaltozyma polyspora DSM 70294]